ncbi:MULTISPECIES: common pilus major fimbrillin subunit EcpA [Serratia]|uniref:Common pilus major fimbrillin subunit EcpA n=1 Tax=Serratia fonticola TaxID=47917 RepID=A0AAP7F5J3_SERFO|nr:MULTISPECIES: common pilus major fimbrillin subunit EcpA [Serratia]ERK13169.1 CFA/I fimbrial major subunit [Serratia fonticola AU-AP2C]MBC3210665.1 fimbrial protein [Serratia fonticola]MBP1037527.1 fimbrial protein [Serratia fonticola]NYA11647.1 fimbrial protein [Serratia fonticola]NYA32791.1 fimbrial protein [Serratia fonticola]
MKKATLVLAIVATLTAVGTAQAENVTTQALATWPAIAVKDSSSQLVVTPIGNLYFQYAEGVKRFNSQQGVFDVALQGEGTAIKLTAKLVSNTLTQLGTSGSTLEVGVKHHGAAITKTAQTTLIDTSAGISGGNLSKLANADKQPGRQSAQDHFDFTIIGATADGTTPVTDFSTLPAGTWSGDVNVRFDVTWAS